jgi:hypothetical protein
MDLDNLGVELRRRNGFESLDLGLAMLQAWRGPVVRAWLATYWPLALVASALLWEHPSLAALVVWWTKPAFDRVLLHVYAAAMFGAPPSTRETLRALPRLLLRTHLLSGLTIGRLSMARSLYLPVAQLEGQGGRAGRARRRVLGARGYGYAAWLTFFCANLVTIWTFGGLLVLVALLPIESLHAFSWQDLFAYDPQFLGVSHAVNAVVFLADTLIEPYFVAAGFSLYLNRRSELEGWDIEVAFRRMTRRRATPPIGSAAGALVAMLVVACTLGVLPVPAEAARAGPPAVDAPPLAPTGPLPYPQGAVKRELAHVLDDPVFGRKETRTRWVLRPTDEPGRRPGWLDALGKRIARFMDAVARAGRVVVWILAAAALGLAIYLVIRHRERWLRRSPEREVPQSLFGLDVRPQSLPADIAAAARAALLAGDAAGALGLLYRGALSALVNFAAVDFRAGDTERDCWRRATPALRDDGGRYFRALLDAWLRTAYAHRPPSPAELARLCDEWSRHFRREAFATDIAP